MSWYKDTYFLDDFDEMEEFDDFDELEKFGKISEIDEIPFEEAIGDMEELEDDELYEE